MPSMATKADPSVAVAMETSKHDTNSSMGGDVEAHTGGTTMASDTNLKRDLGSRHINMIALAGMIVSISPLVPAYRIADLANRERAFS